MQNAALAAAGLTGLALPAAAGARPSCSPRSSRGLPGAGFRGANVTIPHKGAALALATAPTARARAIGAANTLVFESDGEILADNTDAPALIGGAPVRRSAAGPRSCSARVAAPARPSGRCWTRGRQTVRVWNRSPDRARAAVRRARRLAGHGHGRHLPICWSTAPRSGLDGVRSV